MRLIELMSSDTLVAITQPIIMQLRQGARDPAEQRQVKSIVDSAVLLSFAVNIDFDGAAGIYRACRRGGYSVHSVDCMIAAVAIREDATVLSADADFAKIASVVPLRLDPATPGQTRFSP